MDRRTEAPVLSTALFGRRKALVLSAAAGALAVGSACAAPWPTSPVRLVVPFPPGGPADVIGRLLGEKLGEAWGQPVIVENRGGAGGNIGADFVARSAPDGNTLLLAASSHVQGAALYSRLAFDPIRDFTPITQIAYYGLVLVVNPSVPADTLRGFEALLRAEPGGITIASAGTGTPTHLTAELFATRAGITFTHVPYQGAAPAQTALLAGQVQAMFNNPVLAVPAVRAGQLRALATTGSVRSTTLPEAPTVAEEGYPGFESGTWYAVLGPAGMPVPLVAKIDADLRRVVALPAVRQRFATQSLEVRGAGPEGLAATMRDDHARWSEVIRRLGLRFE